MSRPLVREHRAGGFVLAVPLDGPAAVQEVLVGVVAPERQEVAGLGHLLDADVAGSFGNQANVDVACGALVGVGTQKPTDAGLNSATGSESPNLHTLHPELTQFKSH